MSVHPENFNAAVIFLFQPSAPAFKSGCVSNGEALKINASDIILGTIKGSAFKPDATVASIAGESCKSNCLIGEPAITKVEILLCKSIAEEADSFPSRLKDIEVFLALCPGINSIISDK